MKKRLFILTTICLPLLAHSATTTIKFDWPKLGTYDLIVDKVEEPALCPQEAEFNDNTITIEDEYQWHGLSWCSRNPTKITISFNVKFKNKNGEYIGNLENGEYAGQVQYIQWGDGDKLHTQLSIINTPPNNKLKFITNEFGITNGAQCIAKLDGRMADCAAPATYTITPGLWGKQWLDSYSAKLWLSIDEGV